MEITYEDVIAELKTQIADLSYQSAVYKAQLKKANEETARLNAKVAELTKGS